MGRRRREEDERAGAVAAARGDAEQDRRAVRLQRWPGILAAINGLLAACNDALRALSTSFASTHRVIDARP